VSTFNILAFTCINKRLDAGATCADCLQELESIGCVIDKSDYVGLLNVVYVLGCTVA
jgi:hypothetical protein